MDKGWIFPYEDITRGSRIIIYGAGNVGNCFYNQVKSTQYCDIVLWVDAQHEFYRSKGFDVCDPLSINSQTYDWILIAVDSPSVSRDIYAFLEGNGVKPDNIWSPYIRKDNSNTMPEQGKTIMKDYSYLDKMPDISNLRIAFIIPEPIKGGGGHRNIFRVVKRLSDSGHYIDVYCFNNNCSEEETKSNVCEWFYDLQNVNFINYSGDMGVYDVGIATWWETAYIIKKHEDNFRNRFCFTQDFEPFFYPLSSNYILAENTYKLGYKHICSGPWCEKILKERYGADAVSFQFPLDRHIYNNSYERKKKNKNIVFFAKPEMPRRCYEIGIRALEIFHKQRPDVEIILFGSKVLNRSQVSFDVTIRNIVPTLEGLAQMYTDADLGIVFSITNPSLVPYEMMSCGCPVVDLDAEFALSKYGNDNDNVFLFDSLPEKFASELLEIIDDEALLSKKAKHAMEWVENEFPSESEMQSFVENVILGDIKNIVKG